MCLWGVLHLTGLAGGRRVCDRAGERRRASELFGGGSNVARGRISTSVCKRNASNSALQGSVCWQIGLLCVALDRSGRETRVRLDGTLRNVTARNTRALSPC
jgi:hypothetical protein